MEKKEKFKTEDLFGQWHILYSNFPMWTKGNRKNPSLNYSPRDTSSTFAINDTVKFVKNGKASSINGYDRYLGNNKFEWKGKGLLSLLRSKWDIVHMEKEWVLIHFEKTLFTPEGHDLISKNIDYLEDMSEKLEELNLKLSKIDQEQVISEENQ